MPLSFRQTLGENMQKQQFDLQSIAFYDAWKAWNRLLDGNFCDVRIGTLIPVEEAFHINLVTNL